MSNVIQMRRRPRPLRKTYQPNAPYEVEREDQDDGSITFYVADMRPDSFRTLCFTNDDQGRNGYAKFDADIEVRTGRSEDSRPAVLVSIGSDHHALFADEAQKVADIMEQAMRAHPNDPEAETLPNIIMTLRAGAQAAIAP